MIIDLRDYTTTANARDQLIERCETLIFPEQTRLGATFFGSFRDVHDPNRFVWLRGMPTMAERQRILTSFYSHGALWQSQRQEVNSWIADSDNVLLVQAITPWQHHTTAQDSLIGMYSYLQTTPLEPAFQQHLQHQVTTEITARGGQLAVTLATDPSENNYPRHPIRTGAFGLIWLVRYAPDQYQDYGGAQISSRCLQPTSHSSLR